MSVIKAKNSAGEWQAVAAANVLEAIGDLRIVSISRATETTYDLSAYVAPGKNFILAFFAQAHATDSASPAYVWINSDGHLRAEVQANPFTNSNMEYRYLFGNTILNTEYAADDNYITASYDDATRIFTIGGEDGEKPSLGTGKALLFYVG